MKRKDFIIKGGLATIAVAVAAPLSSINALNNNSRVINIGVIGTGDRGGGLIPIVEKIEGLNISACCDILPFRLKEGLAKVSKKVKGYSDYKQLLADKNIDAVLVATPFSTHAQIAIDALDAGKHVYCEKTMVKGYEDILKLVTKVKETKKVFQTGHQYHSSTVYKEVLNLVQNGKVGKVMAFECQYNRNGDWRRPVPEPHMERAINWRMYKEYSGGLLAELCSHQIDFVNWVLDSTPEKVVGFGGVDYWKDGRETFDNIHLVYAYPDGVKATFTSLTSNAKDGYKIKILGDKGSIVIDFLEASFFSEVDKDKKLGNVDGVSGATINWNKDKGIPLNIKHSGASEEAFMDFRDSIVNDKKAASDVISGAKTAYCIQMGLDAMYGNKVVYADLSHAPYLSV